MRRETANIEDLPTDAYGMPFFPNDMTRDGNLYVLPDGGSLIYEPSELSFFGQMLKQFK